MRCGDGKFHLSSKVRMESDISSANKKLIKLAARIDSAIRMCNDLSDVFLDITKRLQVIEDRLGILNEGKK